MDFNTEGIFAALLVSGVGFGFFSYGRKTRRVAQSVGGLVLMVFPYFVSDTFWTLVIGALITGLIILGGRLGW